MALAEKISVDLTKDFPWLCIKGERTEERLKNDEQVTSCICTIALHIKELVNSHHLEEQQVQVCLNEEEYSDAIYMDISVDEEKDAHKLITEVKECYLDYIVQATNKEQMHLIDHFLVRENVIWQEKGIMTDPIAT